jgi:hypothetical protein
MMLTPELALFEHALALRHTLKFIVQCTPGGAQN